MCKNLITMKIRSFISACLLLFVPLIVNAQDQWKIYTDEINIGSLRTGNITQNFTCDKQGNMWISTSKGGILQFNNEQWKLFEVEKISFLFGQSALAGATHLKTGLTSDWQIATDFNGKWMWFGSSRGAILWDGEQMLEMTGALDNDNRMIFYSDEKKEYLIAKDNETIHIEGTEKIKTETRVIQINCVSIDSKGRVWFGTAPGSIYCIDNGVWKVYDQLEKMDLEEEVKAFKREISKIFEDKSGKLWILGNSFIAQIEGDNIKVVKPGNYPKSIFQDSKGNIWIGQMESIEKYDGSTWKTYERDEDKGAVAYMHESKFLEDKDGNLWYSSKVILATRKGGGLYKLENDEWNKVKTEKYYTDLIEDNDGNLWYTGLRRVYKMVYGKWQEVHTAEGFAVFFYELFVDMNNNIWAGMSTVGGMIQRYIP